MKDIRPILFLDIDGVLNSSEYMKTLPIEFYAYEMIDPAAVSLLNDVVKETNCHVVLSSMWRYQYKIDIMNQILHERNASFSLCDYTPHLTDTQIDFDKASKELGRVHAFDHDCLKHTRRGLEIELWIRRNFKNSDIPDLKIAIVDDIDNMHNLKSRLIKTLDFCGLTKNDANNISLMLKRPLGDLLSNTETWWYTNKAGIRGEM